MERSCRERLMAVGNARLKFGGSVRLEHMNLGKDSNGAGGASLRLKMEEKKSKDKTLGLPAASHGDMQEQRPACSGS